MNLKLILVISDLAYDEIGNSMGPRANQESTSRGGGFYRMISVLYSGNSVVDYLICTKLNDVY